MFIYNLFEKQQDPANTESNDLKVVSEAFKQPPESVQDRLYRRQQELRKKRGAPDPDYYKELKGTFDLPDDERWARVAELKKKYRIEEGEYANDDEYYDQDEQESELYSGCYVRDEQDPSGEIFQMRGDPTERRVQILDRNGSGWNISPDRLTLVGEGDPDIGRYFGGKDIDEGNELNVGVEAYGVRGENNKKWRKTFKSQAAFEKWLDAHQDNVEVLGTREVNLNNMFKEGKWFKTQYGWAGGSKPGGGKYKHPDQIKADRAAKKAEKEKQSSDAFGGMFGGGNPADKLSIRKEGVEEDVLLDLQPGDDIRVITTKGRTYTGVLNRINDNQSIVFTIIDSDGNPHDPTDSTPRKHVVAIKMSHVAKIEPAAGNDGVAEGRHRDPDWYLEPDQPKSARYQPNPDRERGRQQQRDTDYPAEPTARYVPSKEEIAHHKAEKSRKAKELAGVMKHMWGKKNMSEGRVDSPVSQAITRRMLDRHHGLISKYGPENIMSAIDQVADWAGDVDEIGSSDVNEWVQQVIRMVQTRAGEGLGEAANPAQQAAIAIAKKKEQDINEDIERYVEALSRAGYEITEAATMCPECGGPAYEDKMLAEKQDACYHKVKSRYKVWPSAYASGALVRCRKAGAKNWGNKSKK
jgi:hypothetical protein